MRDELSKLLVDVCFDVRRLDEVRADPDAALREAGVPPAIRQLVARRRGAWISSAVRLSRAVPPAAAIEDWVRERAAGDPAFVEQIRREPREIIDRALQVRLPASATVEVVETSTGLEVRIAGLELASSMPVLAADEGGGQDVQVVEVDVDTDVDTDVGADAPGEGGAEAIEIDVDVDIDVDIDVDVDVDVDIDVDLGVVVDVDVDVDIDIDNVVDNVVDNVTMTPTSKGTREWMAYWEGRRALWRAADDRDPEVVRA